MYLDNWFLGVQRGSASTWWWRRTTSARAGGNMYYRWDINRFNGDLLDGRLDRILPGFCGDQLHGRDRREPLPRRRRGGQGQPDGPHLGAAYTLGKAIDRSSTSTPPQRPDAYGPADQDEGPADFDVRTRWRSR